MAKRKPVTGDVVEEPTLQYINLTDIVPSKANPRTTFDQAEMDELIDSVRTLGVIQPITVRPLGDKYELVCGERRYRAAMAVRVAIQTRTTIPASIRQLTDEEAMELMITENLQRKDVHPLEEATAFQFMLDNMKYHVVDIAAKIGKNEPFVVRRLQLLKLVPELSAIFKSNELSIGHAELLSRVDAQPQLLWFTDKYSAQWQGGQGTIKQLRDWLTSKTENKLKDAIFKIDYPYDGDNYVSVSCHDCRLNSSVNHTLFPDTAAQAICNGPQCFKAKSIAEFEMRLNSALIDPEVHLIGRRSWNEQDIVKKLKNDGYTVLTQYDDYSTVNKPELEDYTDDIDRDDYETDEAYESELAEAKKSFESDLADFLSKDQAVIKGFDIESGKYENIVLKPTKATGSLISQADPTKELREQRLKLKEKFNRGRELDDEKVMGRYINHIRNDVKLTGMVFPDQYQLSELETTAMICIAYQKADWSYQRTLKQMLFKNSTSMSSNEQDFKLFYAIHDAPPEIRAFLVRQAIFNTFSAILPKGLNGGVMFGLSAEWESEAYNLFREEQNGIKARREAKLQPRIDELDVKIKELEAAK